MHHVKKHKDIPLYKQKKKKNLVESGVQTRRISIELFIYIKLSD